jgi:DNA-binding LacI/PurR family transcriptional regulator
VLATLNFVTGARRPTLADVATAAGVSRALVSIVIRGVPGASEATRARVIAVADELGYRPDQRARLLRQRENRVLGVAFDVRRAFHSDLVGALYTAAEAVGYDVVLSGVTTGRSEQRAVTTLLDERCGVVIALGPTASRAELEGLARRVPVVTIARRLRAVGVDTVRTADAAGLRDAVDHLVGLGHQRIVHVDGGKAPGAADRRRGYRDAMTRHGLRDFIDVVGGGDTEEDGARATAGLLADLRPSLGRPTAMVAFNDACALGVLDTLLRSGRNVPAQVSVIGFDDSRLARLAHIDLTTIAQPIDGLARAAVDCALQRLTTDPVAAPTVGSDIELPPWLIVRSTTAAPSTGA